MKIVVLASFRTGSTALSDLFSKIYKCENFREFFNTKYDNNFHDFPLTEKSWVIKIMADQIIEPYFSNIIANSDKIYGIYRKDVIAQIASFLIANKTNQFHFDKKQPKLFNVIQYTDFELERYIQFIQQSNQQYNLLLKPLCSVEYAYEDCKNFLKLSTFRESDRPFNYQDIIESIRKYLDSQFDII